MREEIWLSNQDDPWVWEFEADQYIKINEPSFEAINSILSKKAFFKLSCFLPIESYIKIPEKGKGFLQMIIGL